MVGRLQKSGASQRSFAWARNRPKPAFRKAPKQPDDEPPIFLFRFYEAAVRDLTDPATSRRWRRSVLIEPQRSQRNVEPVPVQWTPRSAMSVIHGRPVPALATNRCRPSVGNAVPLIAPALFSLVVIRRASASRIQLVQCIPETNDDARCCSNRCTRRSPVWLALES